jgi:uncharacterized GH25 family protein
MKKAASLMVLCVVMGLVQAHEFWLQPRAFVYKPGDQLVVDFMVGEGFDGAYWDLQRHRVERLDMYNRFGVTDLSKDLKATQGSNLTYTFSNVGTHLLALQSNSAYIELDAEKFNAYLDEDGLDNVKALRHSRGEEQKLSRENYRRFAKLLVQSGDHPDDTYKQKVGLRLEIIPMQNPYAMKAGDYLECSVYYEGQPEAHALVKVWNHIGNRVFLQNIYSENDGSIKFPISNAGPWMVSTVKMVASESPDADWESMWASLVFEIEESK